MIINRVLLHHGLSVLAAAALGGAPPLASGAAPQIHDLAETGSPILSADGSTVVGNTDGSRVYRWTAPLGKAFLAPPSGYTDVRVNGISANGGALALNLRAGSGPFFESARWTVGGGVEILGSPSTDFNITFSNAITADGAKVLVRANSILPSMPITASAFFWNEGAGYGPEIDLVNGSIPQLMSGDGTCLVGDFYSSSAGRTTPWKWSGSGWVDLGPVPLSRFGLHSASRAIDHAGTTIVGGTTGTTPIQIAWRWTPGGGMEDLGSLPTTLGYTRSGALDVSAGGEFIVGDSTIGYTGSDFVTSAFLWTEGTGMLDLNEYLPTLGLDLTGWRLTRATGVSADGSVLVGMGEFNGVESAWVISGIPAPGTLAALGAFSILTSRRQRPTRTLPQERSAS